MSLDNLSQEADRHVPYLLRDNLGFRGYMTYTGVLPPRIESKAILQASDPTRKLFFVV